MTKKIFVGLIIVLSIFAISTLTLAQTTTSTSVPTTTLPKPKPIKPHKPFVGTKSTSTIINTPTTTLPKPKPIKPHKPFVGAKSTTTISTSTACYKEKVINLTREMQLRKKQALREYRSALKSATSTAAKREARKTYKNKIKEINDWYYQELKQAKIDCGLSPKAKERKQATTTQNITSTSTTSTQ